MGQQSSGPRKVVIRLEYLPQRIIPIPARFVDVDAESVPWSVLPRWLLEEPP